ncbi:DUF4365 domain-containing protein [Streptosporangium sp. NPDC002607]
MSTYSHSAGQDLRGGKLPKVPDSRKPSRAAVNALRTLLERHNHIVQEIDGQNDFGEDLHVTFVANRQFTGDMIKIQVKGGRSWRRKSDYSMPVGRHGDTWSNGNVPVICVVQDPETENLYWANATQQLLSARRERRILKAIAISAEDLLNDASMADFVFQARGYASRYRGNQAIRIRLGEMAGVEFGSSDIVKHFVNVHGEDLIFRQCRGEGYATLLHSDLDWKPEYIGPEMLRFDTPMGLPGHGSAPTVGGVILELSEAMWLAACFRATDWAREAVPGQEPPTKVEVLNDYVSKCIYRRLAAVPDLLALSLSILRSGSDVAPNVLDEIRKLQSDADILKEAHSASWETWDDMSPKAQRLTTLYLIKDVVVGPASLPIEQQFRIIWRWSQPWGEYGFSARVGQPSTRLTSRREVVSARHLVAGDKIYWLSRHGNERGRLISDIWKSEETPGAICIRFEQQSLGDTFWPAEQFARAKQKSYQVG